MQEKKVSQTLFFVALNTKTSQETICHILKGF